MKVLHLNAGNETGGGMVHILSLLKEIKSERIFLGLFEEGVFQQEAVKNGIQTVTFTQKNRYDLSVISRVVRFIKENQIDMIHTHGARANLYGYFLKKLTKVTWVTTVHSDPRNDFLGRGVKGELFTKLNMGILKKVDHLFAISERFKDMLVNFHIDSDRITTIYNGINFEEKNTYDLEGLRKEWGLHQDDFVITMVARFDPVKCHTLAFAALKEVVRTNPNVKLLLVGDGPIREELERTVKEDQLEPNIVFFGQQKDVDRFYQLADVTLLTSKTESFPLVLLESARACTPAITTDVGGVQKMIPDPTFGFIVAVDHKDEIVSALEKAIVLKINNELSQMGRRFYDYTSQHFSLQSFAKSIQDVYQYLDNHRHK
jgi:L-malate glycosyltransferase